MHLILPKKRPLLNTPEFRTLPLFFLAGPIQGAGDWHVRMAETLADEVGNCLIVNPSRYTDKWHPHRERELDGRVLDERQTDWERYYLEQAALHWHAGCIVFWLAEQLHPREDGDPYATDTYGELGEWRGRMIHDLTLRVVVGAEPGFRRLNTIARNFERALGSDFVIHDSMEKVAMAARLYAHP